MAEPPPTPLPTLLSRALVAHTIEFDNEVEHRLPHTTARGPAAHSGRGPWLVSRAMWSNFLRYVPPGGVPLDQVRDLAPLTNLGGLTPGRAPSARDPAPPGAETSYW